MYDHYLDTNRESVEAIRPEDLTPGLADESHDAVITFDVIEHLTKAETLPLVDEVRRVLKPGARWIIHTINGESPFYGRVLYGDFTHEQAFTRVSIAQLLIASGFSSVKSYDDQPRPHGLKSAVRWLLWKLLRAWRGLVLSVESGGEARNWIYSQNHLAVAVK